LSDKVKLTKKQREALDKAPRRATGESLSLDPRGRLNTAGLGWIGGPEITVSAPTGRPALGAYSTIYTARHSTNTKPGYTRGTFSVYVVDAEVFLSSAYNGFAFGIHDPYHSRWSGGKASPFVEDPRDSDRLLIQANKIAKAMQNILADRNEPVPDASEVQRQKLAQDSKIVNKTLHHFELILRALRDSSKEEVLDLASDVAELRRRAINQRNRMDIEADNIERVKQGKEPLDTEMMTLT
jgi:hypothetical protein